MTITERILTLAGAVGVTGAEAAAEQTARAMLEPLGRCESTPLGGMLCRIRDAGPQKPHLMLTAHIDQIGMIVSYIEESGFLRVAGCGGLDRATLLAAQVLVHTQAGALPGVVCTIPPHLSPDEEKLPKVEELCIDVGLSGEAAAAQIALGDRVSFCGWPRALPDGIVCAPALDDRAGCAAVIAAAERLAELALDCSLSVALVGMEEVGSQGARAAVATLSPTHAIAVDVSFAHTPDSPRPKCGLRGKGAMIGIAPVLDNGMLAAMKRVAAERALPVQLEVMGGATGTDVDGIATYGAGVRCALISIPLKYMHTPIETLLVSDLQAVVDLMVEYVRAEFGGGGDAV